MKQALIYVRCASPNDHAIQCQQRACKAFAEEHGYNVSEIIVERGVAGRVSQRVSLDLLLKLAGQRRFDALILHSGSRISRNAPEAFSFWMRSLYAMWRYGASKKATIPIGAPPMWTRCGKSSRTTYGKQKMLSRTKQERTSNCPT